MTPDETSTFWEGSNLACSQSCSGPGVPVLGSNAAWLCITSSCRANWREGHKSILIGSYRNWFSLSSVLFFVMLHHIWMQQFQPISLLLMSSVLYLLLLHLREKLSDLLRTWRASVAIILSTSFSSIQKISCTSTPCSPDCCSFLPWLIPLTCAWSYHYLIPPGICLFLASLSFGISHLLVCFFWVV